MKQDIVYVPVNSEKISRGLTINVDGKTVYEHPPIVPDEKKIILKPVHSVHVFTDDELKEHDKEIIEWYQKGLDYGSNYKAEQKLRNNNIK